MIEGLNGTIELKDKYVIVTIKEKNNKPQINIIKYTEIEDVFYKKPTRDLYGYIAIYLYTLTSYSKTPISFKIILDRVDEKSIDSYLQAYNKMKKASKVNQNTTETVREEHVKSEEKEEVEDHRTEEKPVVKTPNVTIAVDERPIIKPQEVPVREKPIVHVLVNPQKEIKPEKVEEKKPVKQEIKETPKKVEESKPEIKTPVIETIKPTVKEAFVGEKKQPEKQLENKPEIKTEPKGFINEPSKEVTISGPVKQEVIEEKKTSIKDKTLSEKNIETINVLNDRLKTLGGRLKKLSYENFILSKYVSDTTDKREIDKYLSEIDDMLRELEKIEKEIKEQEKRLKKGNIISFPNGKATILIASDRLNLIDRKKLKQYIDTYKNTIKELNKIESKEKELNSKATKKKTEIGIADDRYEVDINLLYGVKTNKEFIEKYNDELRSKMRQIHTEISKTVEPHKRYRLVKKHLSESTKTLATITTLNSLRPGRNRLIAFALSVGTGIRAIGDMLHPKYKYEEENYYEVITKEYLVGINDVNTAGAKKLIVASKGEIDKLIKDCDKYSDYDDFYKLKEDLLDVKKSIEREEYEIELMDEKLRELKQEKPLTKVLKVYGDK